MTIETIIIKSEVTKIDEILEVKSVPFNPCLKIVENPFKILHLISLGTNIPVLKEFEQFILFDLKHFNAKSLILVESESIIGHILIYQHEPDVMYFGFFGVTSETKENISKLIGALLSV